MHTYLSIPFITAACFFAATFKAWLRVARPSIPVLVLLALLWLVLLIAALRDGNLEVGALVAAIATLLGAGLTSRWLGPRLQVSPDLARVIVVDGVLVGLGIANVVVAIRRRRRKASP